MGRPTGDKVEDSGTDALVGNFDGRPNSHGIKKLHDVAALHANASVADGASDVALVGRAMNVDAAAVGPGVLFFRAAEMKDACDDWIPARCVNLANFARTAAAFEDGADRCSVADFRCYNEVPEWCGVAPVTVAESECGCGDTVGSELLFAVEKVESLFWNADPDLDVLGGKCRRRDECAEE